MIKGTELENRIADPNPPEPPMPRGGAEVVETIKAMKAGKIVVNDVVARLAELERRIQSAKDLLPPRGIEDGRCWGMGRDSAIAAIEGE